MISQTELAKRLGVSQTAVSAALRHREKELRLDPALAERIRTLACRLAYRPNLLARSLAQKRTHTFGVVVSDFSDPTFGSLLNHLQDQALQAGHELMVTGCGDRELETARIWERLAQRRVDAVLWVDLPVHVSLSKLKRLWKTAAIPVIGIGTAFRKADIPAVVFDSHDAVQKLARYMPFRMASPLVFLQSNPHAEFSIWRWQCVRKIWGKRGIAMDCETKVDLRQLIRIHKSHKPLALMGDQDLTSLRMLNLLLAAGWSPQRDFLLGSFDGLSWLQSLKPSLTSVRQPIEKMAEQAIWLALSPHLQPKVHLLQGTLIRGETL